MAITLQHDAYRDGIKSCDNKAETYQAVLAHTLMASKLAAKDTSFLDQKLNMDLLAFSLGGSVFSKYVDGAYDPSADYWKLTADGRLLYDGQASLVDENGEVLISFKDMELGKNTQIEGALLYLLGVDPKDERKVQEVRDLMVSSGLQHSDSEYSDDWMWRGIYEISQEGADEKPKKTNLLEENKDKEINMRIAMNVFGNSMSSLVFASYYNGTVDTEIARFLGKDLGEYSQEREVYSGVRDRYTRLYAAKEDFYASMVPIVDLEKGYCITLPFMEKYDGHYENWDYMHYGFDLSRKDGSQGDAIFAGIGGKVIAENWYPGTNKDGAGNSLRVEYGFSFEGSFIGCGIYGEYLHMQDQSKFNVGDMLAPNDRIGKIGGTFGYAPHLHFDMLTRGVSFQASTMALLFRKDFDLETNASC